MIEAKGTATPSRRRPAPRLGSTFVEMVRDLARDLFDPYRPELHYMRGPGPKWQAKHAVASAPAGLTEVAI